MYGKLVEFAISPLVYQRDVAAADLGLVRLALHRPEGRRRGHHTHHIHGHLRRGSSIVFPNELNLEP